jgi:hypothetical protein
VLRYVVTDLWDPVSASMVTHRKTRTPALSCMVPPHFFVWEWDAQARTAGAVDFAPFLPWESLTFRVLPDTMSRKADRGKIRVEYVAVLSLPRLRVYDP